MKVNLQEKYKLFINGEWKDSSDNVTLKTYNLAKALDRLTEEEAKIEIYPTVILALPDNVLKASRDETIAVLNQYRRNGEEDDV